MTPKRPEEEIPRVTTSFRIKPEILEKLKRHVAELYLKTGHHETLSHILEEAIEEWLRRHPVRKERK